MRVAGGHGQDSDICIAGFHMDFLNIDDSALCSMRQGLLSKSSTDTITICLLFNPSHHNPHPSVRSGSIQIHPRHLRTTFISSQRNEAGSNSRPTPVCLPLYAATTGLGLGVPSIPSEDAWVVDETATELGTGG